jgi:hypothetical protein
MVNSLDPKYPHLARFCSEEGIQILPYEHSHQCLTLKDLVVYRVPEGLKESYEIRITICNQCLEFAYNHDALGLDRRSRLRGRDNVRFWSLLNELKVGLWLESQGLHVCFDPAAQGGGIGEFEASSVGDRVFVEVKTLFGDRDMLGQEAFLAKLADWCERERLPVESLNLLEYACDLGEEDFDTIFRKIKERILQSGLVLCGDRQTIEYSDESGIVIEIGLCTDCVGVLSLGYGGWIGVEGQLRCKLGMPGAGKNCRVQTAAASIPSLVIVYDMSQWLQPLIVEAVLYGKLVQVSPSGRFYREADGKWNRGIENPLSAVGVFRQSFAARVETAVDMYLCPRPRFPLDKHLFTDRGIRWLRLGDDGTKVVQG